MEPPEFIFCEWNNRFWPAKVLRRCKPCSLNNSLEVEIFEVQEQASVNVNYTRPFQMGELEHISNDLDRSENLIVTSEELKHRAALRSAMDILKESPQKTSKVEGEPEAKKPLRKRCREKETLSSAIASTNTSSVKRKRSPNSNGTEKPTTGCDILKAKNDPSDNPEVEDKKLQNPASRRNIKGSKEADAEQAHTSGTKVPKTKPNSSVTTKEHNSDKKSDSDSLKKGKGTTKRLKSEKSLPKSPNNDAGKAKTSRQQGNTSKQITSRSTACTDELKSGRNKVTGSSTGKSLHTENKGQGVLPKPDVISHEKKRNSKTMPCSSTPSDEHRTVKGRGTTTRFNKCLATENKEHCILSDTDKDHTKKGKEHSKKQKLGPKNDKVEQAAKIPQGDPTDSEHDSQTKGKFNQLPLPDFSFGCESDNLSSDLSVDCCSPEAKALQDLWQKDDSEEDIQLPVVNFQQESSSFKPADFVWCKYQRYPYWPSLVKSVRNKEKKASIVFVEESLSDPNCKNKSFQVGFRTLKHYDCPEKQELLGIARKDYGKSIDWCDALICDYRIRLGCGSFSGPFLEYCTAAISYPVRRESKNIRLNFPSLSSSDSPTSPHNPDTNSPANKTLPDRSRASRDKANSKLVECIVKAQQVDAHLIDILKGKKSSLWLKKFQTVSRGVVCMETYLEDEEQIDLVVNYLYALCDKMHSDVETLMKGDPAKFILEVMFPEAVISAIAVTNNISYDKAKNLFLEGPLLSTRERQLFEKQISEKKAAKLKQIITQQKTS